MQDCPCFLAAVPAHLVKALMKTIGGEALPLSLRGTCAQALCNIVFMWGFSRPNTPLPVQGAADEGITAHPPPASLEELIAEGPELARVVTGALEAAGVEGVDARALGEPVLELTADLLNDVKTDDAFAHAVSPPCHPPTLSYVCAPPAPPP